MIIPWILKFLGLYEPLMWLTASLDTTREGASARKLTAFSLNMAFLYLIYKYSQKTEFTHFETVCIIILAGAAFFQALITVPDLLKGMNIFRGNKTEITEKTTVESKETKIENN